MTSPNVITVTVKCDLDLDEIYGRVHVYTTSDKSMDWVLEEFCREKNVRRVSTFALKSGTGQDYDLTMTISQCGLGDGDLIYCYNKNPPKPKPPPKSRQKPGRLFGSFCLLGVLFLLVALAGMIAVIVIYELHSKNQRVFSVVVDAGSTSSKIYLYSWPASLFFNTGKVQQDVYYKARKPLSDFIALPGNGSQEIMAAIRTAILDKKKIPSTQISQTPLYLGATAGMRMLKDRDSAGVEALFARLRTDLATMKLQISDPKRQVRIISGTEEGVDAWVTVNYLEGTLIQFADNMVRKPSEINTIGSLELGGASTQIAFAPYQYDAAAAKKTDTVSQMKLYGRDYSVYSHSFLCYGKTMAQYRLLAILLEGDGNFTRNVVDNPCMPMGFKKNFTAKDFLRVPCTRGKHAVQSYGYEIIVPDFVKPNTQFQFVGTGSYSACQNSVGKLFGSGTRIGTPCPYARCSINGMYQPDLSGKFKGFAGYYYVADFFNATETKDRSKATLAQFTNSVKTFCGKSWTDIKAVHGDSSFIPNYCFDGIYVTKLLQSYGFNNSNWADIEFVSKVRGNAVGWSLGFTVLESGRISTESFISISLPLFIGLLILFILILIMAVILFAVAIYNSRGRRYNANLGTESTGYGSI